MNKIIIGDIHICLMGNFKINITYDHVMLLDFSYVKKVSYVRKVQSNRSTQNKKYRMKYKRIRYKYK